MSSAKSHPGSSSSSPTSPTSPPPVPPPLSPSASFFTYPVTYAVSGIIRRMTADHLEDSKPSLANTTSSSQASWGSSNSAMEKVYTPPRRTASPFQPPPLTPLALKGFKRSTTESARLLTRSLAEEIRLLVPPRLQLADSWSLKYCLEQDGVSLATLYKKCEEFRGKLGGFILVVRDGEGGTFGAYLSDPPHPSAHYFGTGECFLWRAHVLPAMPDLSSLPPPPSADTTTAQRWTTIGNLKPPAAPGASQSGTSTPERIRFKAFPFSGVNDYMIFCEQGYLSIGGGDGHYGLWLDDNLEKGISSTCPTYGNEPLSDEGTKFEVIGVELWSIGP